MGPQDAPDVHLYPAPTGTLPAGAAAIVLTDDGLDVYYTQDHTLPTEQLCAYGDAALTAGLKHVVRRLRSSNGHDPGGTPVTHPPD